VELGRLPTPKTNVFSTTETNTEVGINVTKIKPKTNENHRQISFSELMQIGQSTSHVQHSFPDVYFHAREFGNQFFLSRERER